jgi:hypothetical protein
MTIDLEQLCWEKEKRVMDAIELRVPDRVPVIASIGYFPAKYTGIPCEAAWYDFDRWFEACQKTMRDFQPDFGGPQPFFPGKAYEYLRPRTVQLPGHGISPYHGHQSIELEFMKSDEYTAMLTDPSDYTLRTYFPRVYESMAGFTALPKISGLGGMFMSADALALALVRPDVAASIRALQKTGREILRWRARMARFRRKIENMGFLPFVQGVALAPFDVISHSFRGMHGTMADMFRRPEKLIQACEKTLETTLDKPMPEPNRYGNIRIGMPLTRGSDDFMSLKHFETFYWPTLKKLMVTLIERGAIVCPFYEGNFVTRLEHFLELPPGKVLAHFDTTDIFKAKDVLKGHTCIQGNVPVTLLQMGTIDQVKGYCKKLIDVVGKDGGFILSPRSSIDEVKPENLKTMIEFTKEYGVYK